MGFLVEMDGGVFGMSGRHGALHGDGVDGCRISLVRLDFVVCDSRCSGSIAVYFCLTSNST